jgi:uncharacterized protein YcbK (DUF882 family)
MPGTGEEKAGTAPEKDPAEDAGEFSASGLGRRAFLGGAASLAAATTVASAVAAPPPARGLRKLALYSPHTEEHFDDIYWYNGSYLDGSLDRISWLMRDFHRNMVTDIDPSLVDLLFRLRRLFTLDQPMHILSGYRTAATNRMLALEGHAPAAHSQHLLGKAADIRIEGVSLARLRAAALSFEAGGVGTYWAENFLHVDVGPVRTW